MAKRSLLAMGVVLLMILMALSAWAVPTMTNYQGKLTDKNGIPLNDTYNMTFYLFTAASGGTAIWTENHTSVTVTDGIYNVILGSINPLATGLFIDNDQLYLEVEIEGETLAPRQQLTSAPYALKARASDGVVHGGITTVMIADGAVDSQKLENDAVTGTKIADGTVSYVDIQDGSTLEEIKDDDGTGSGLDADKLDGLEASAFMASGADNWVDENGDDMTGRLTVTKPYVGPGVWEEAIKGSLLGSSAVGAGIFGYTDGDSSFGVSGAATGTSGRGVYGWASNDGDGRNYGGHFSANGALGVGVYGEASDTGGPWNFGGLFEAAGIEGIGVFGKASNTGDVRNVGGVFLAEGKRGKGVAGYASNLGGVENYGGYFEAAGTEGRGVYGYASNEGDVENYGGYFEAAGENGRGVYGYASTAGDVLNFGGFFEAKGGNGRGVFGYAAGENGRGVYGMTHGTNATGVHGVAAALTGTTVGIRGTTFSPDGYGGYFEGRVRVIHSDSGLTPTNLTGLFVENNGNGNDFFVFQTATAGGGKSFSITNAGRVGIGTTSPGYRLDVAGRARMLTGSDNSAGIWFTNKDDSENRAFFGMNGDDQLGFYGNGGAGWGLVFNVNYGTVGIGTDAPEFFKLAVNGSAAKPGGGSWSSFSDVRLKDIGERYEHGLEEITKIDPVKYRYKEENALGLPSDGEYVGLIAQEVQEVIPEAVEQNKQGYLMVNEGPINYAMLNAIKELSAEVKRLKKRIEELETNKQAEIESLKDQFTSLQKVVKTLIAQQSDFKDNKARLSMQMWR